MEKFGGVDVCINNASAINLAPIEQIDMRRYDLVQQINTRGTFVTSRACLPHLRQSQNPHVLTLSPPLDLRPKWFAPHLAYSLSKYGMSLCVLGLAEEYRAAGIACNALWPRTTIATAAVEFALGGPEMMRRSRKPQIVADAAHVILNRPARESSGQFFIDDSVLYQAGVRDFSPYSVEPGAKLLGDLFIDIARNGRKSLLIEPHSEHVLARIRRRIAEKKIDTSTVAVYYCEPAPTGTRITQITVNERGQYEGTGIPSGFFEESYEESVEQFKALASQVR